MKLVRVNPFRQEKLLCCKCSSWKEANHTFADLEGEPFKAYYCDPCVLADSALLESVVYSKHLAELHAGESFKTCPMVKP